MQKKIQLICIYFYKRCRITNIWRNVKLDDSNITLYVFQRCIFGLQRTIRLSELLFSICLAIKAASSLVERDDFIIYNNIFHSSQRALQHLVYSDHTWGKFSTKFAWFWIELSSSFWNLQQFLFLQKFLLTRIWENVDLRSLSGFRDCVRRCSV